MTWLVWLATAVALPVPPWSAAATLARETDAARRLARPARAPVWSIDIGGGLQAGALGQGWGVDEAYLDGGRRRTFAWIGPDEARVRFASPGWDAAQLTLLAYPLPELGPLAVTVTVDGEARGELEAAPGWSLTHLAIGSVSRGSHVLALRPARSARPAGEARTLSLAVAGLAVSEQPQDDPDRDRGVFAGQARIGLEPQPALLVSSDAAPEDVPSRATCREIATGLTACIGLAEPRAAHPAPVWLEALHGLATAALLLLAPGLGWAGLWRVAGRARLVAILAASTLVLLACFVSLRALGVAPEPLPLAGLLALLGGAGLLVPRRTPIDLSWTSVFLALLASAALTAFAARVVPPLEDQDMEVQATAHALATRQVPLALTNRGTAWFFAHPPLLHFWEAGSFALGGRLERVRFYETAAEAEAARPFREPEPGAPLAARPHYAAWLGLLRRFYAEPQLWTTRRVNVLLAALSVALVAAIASELARSRAAGVGLSLVLLSFPELLVRGAYGGYYAATALASLLLLAALAEAAPPATLATGSALAFLANQKGLLVPVAWALAAPRGVRRERFVPLAGAALGVALFAAWGLASDAPSFVYDFAKEHVLRRLAPSDVRFVADPARGYPSIPGLWRELVSHFGLLFCLWGGAAALRGVRHTAPAVRSASAAVLLGALAFSLTDWRQTKHLAILAPLALVAIAGGWPEGKAGRRLAFAALALVLVTNLRAAAGLAASFESLRVTPGW